MFIKYANIVWAEDERLEFISWIAENPLSGDVIPNSGGCRKIRWSRNGMGKRGGVRVIYYKQLEQGSIVLLIVYAKAKFDNLPSDFLKALKQEFMDD